jgi:hypothetical protein
MTQECSGCGGRNCSDCGQHVHDWGGHHYCHIAIARRISAELTEFEKDLTRARAVGAGNSFHAVDCRTVKAHITVARNIIASNEAAYSDYWRLWRLVHDQCVVGYGNQCCSPPVTIQPPARRMVRRLTGIGWPGGDGRCSKGRLPLWTREAM